MPDKKNIIVAVLLFFLGVLASLFIYFHRLSEAPFLLTESEVSWLKNRDYTITITGDPGYYPIDYHENGIHGGYCSDLLSILENDLGIKFKYIPAKSWAEALATAKKGEVQVLSSAAPTLERREYLNFTQVYLDIPNYIITHSDNQDILVDSDLVGKSVAITKNYGSQFYYQKNYPGISIVSVPNDELALQEVSLKNVDAVVGDLIGTSYYVDRKKVSNIKVVSEAEYSWKLAFGISDKDSILTSILNKGLDRVSSSEWSELNERWVNYKFEDYGLHKTIIVILAILISLVLFSLGIIFLWNRRLKDEVELQTQELNLLKLDLEEKVNSKTIKLDDTIKKLTETNKESNRLFSIVSHDLKNSFHGLIGISAILRNAKDMEETELNKFLDAISNTSASMHKLLLNLLDWTTSKSSDVKEESVYIDVETVLSDLVSQFEVNCLVKNIRVIQKVDSGRIKIGVSRFCTILRNLLDNAIKFSEVSSEILLEAHLFKDKIEVKITDYGAGCDDVLENVFATNRHQRQTGTVGEKGTGLGLMLCKKCVEELNGTLSMVSKPGEGSTFTIQIPIEY